MKIADSHYCTSCNEVDYTEHFFFHCQKVRFIWLEIEKIIAALTNYPLKITEAIVLTGFIGKPKRAPLTQKKINLINQLISIGKVTISKFKYGKYRNILEIFETECRLRKIYSNKDL